MLLKRTKHAYTKLFPGSQLQFLTRKIHAHSLVNGHSGCGRHLLIGYVIPRNINFRVSSQQKLDSHTTQNRVQNKHTKTGGRLVTAQVIKHRMSPKTYKILFVLLYKMLDFLVTFSYIYAVCFDFSRLFFLE